MLDFLNYSKLLNVQHTWLLYEDHAETVMPIVPEL